jgi:hypothetical protein
MGILDIFHARKKITAQDIRIEKVRLEQREKKMASDIQNLQKEKEELFRKGAETGSKSLRTVYARRFEETTKRLQLLERESIRLWKEVRVITALNHVFEHTRGSGGERLLARLSDKQVTDVMRLIDSDDIKGQLFSEKLDEMLGLVEAADTAKEPVGPEGEEILRVWEKMDEGKMEFEEGLKQADEETKKKSKEAQP